MPWTYDPSLPTDRDKVRALIGDIHSESQKVTNEQIELFLSLMGGNLWRAAASALDGIAASYANQAAVSLGPLSVNYASDAQTARDLAAQYRKNADRGLDTKMLPFAGGVFKSDVERGKENDSLVPAYFEEGMHDDPTAGQDLATDAPAWWTHG